MKTALYASVSTDEEAEDNNIESQVAALPNHARANDYEVIFEFQDDGVSGATYLKDKPGGKVLLKERVLPKQRVAGSSPVSRSRFNLAP